MIYNRGGWTARGSRGEPSLRFVCAASLHYPNLLSWGGIQLVETMTVMLLLKQPLCNHITGRATASTMLNGPFWKSTVADDRRGWDRRTDEDVTCIAFLQRLSGFTVRWIQPITSFPLSSTIAARVPIVYPSEKVIPRCQVQHRKWLGRRSSVWLWQARLPALVRLTGERVTKRFWGPFRCQPCRTGLTRDVNRLDTEQYLRSFPVRIGFFVQSH